MHRSVGWLRAVALMPLTACSQGAQAPQQAPVTAVSAEAADSSSEVASVCAAAVAGYSPVPAMGPRFPAAPLPMFKVAGAAGINYASKPQPVGFPGDGATVHAAYVRPASHEFQLVVCVRLSPRHGYAQSRAIDSQGGRHPLVADMFLANADADPAPELVLLVAWPAANALGTSGTLFEPWVFDPPVTPGALQRVVIADPALSSGFDGIREGKPVRYPYQDAAAFRLRLQQLGY